MWYIVFFFKQKTAYEMRISDWSSDVCSSDLFGRHERARLAGACVHRLQYAALLLDRLPGSDHVDGFIEPLRSFRDDLALFNELGDTAFDAFRRHARLAKIHSRFYDVGRAEDSLAFRADEHTFDLQSLMRTS